MRLLLVDAWHPAVDVVVLAGDPGEDRWFAFGDGVRPATTPRPEFFEEIVAIMDGSDAGVLERALAGFGLPWGALDREVLTAQTMFLATAPPAFARELLEWSPADIRGLRERWVEGGMSSFVDALLSTGRYRREGMWDRKVGPLYG